TFLTKEAVWKIIRRARWVVRNRIIWLRPGCRTVRNMNVAAAADDAWGSGQTLTILLRRVDCRSTSGRWSAVAAVSGDVPLRKSIGGGAARGEGSPRRVPSPTGG